MLNLASLCFPDNEKSCFYCCPPIRDPDADPLDSITEKHNLLRRNSKNLQKNLAAPHEISGTECWGLGFLDDQEKLAGCLLHPLRHQGRDLRHLTGYQFKCANALCREAQIFAGLTPTDQIFCLSLCRKMDSFHYSSRRNPLMRLLAWEKEMVEIIIFDARKSVTISDSSSFIAQYEFLWQKLDFRLDGYLGLLVTQQEGFNFLRHNLETYTNLRNELISELKNNPALQTNSTLPVIPSHKLAIPLNLSRLLKFGADLWELPCGCETEIMNCIENKLNNI